MRFYKEDIHDFLYSLIVMWLIFLFFICIFSSYWKSIKDTKDNYNIKVCVMEDCMIWDYAYKSNWNNCIELHLIKWGVRNICGNYTTEFIIKSLGN